VMTRVFGGRGGWARLGATTSICGSAVTPLSVGVAGAAGAAAGAGVGVGAGVCASAVPTP